MVTIPLLCTPHMVAGITDAYHTPTQLERACATATGRVVALLRRTHLHPYRDTLTFTNYGRADRVYLDPYTAISVSSITADGTTITASGYALGPEPGDWYPYVESVDGSGIFPTTRRGITITALWGVDDTQTPTTTLVGDLTDTATSVTVADSSSISAGQYLTIGTERLTVSATSLTGTGQDLAANLAATAAANTLTLDTGTGVSGEVITIGSEQMRVLTANGTTLTVTRAINGTILAAHTTGDPISAPRLLTVTRAAGGSTAAAHTSGDTITRWDPPAALTQLAAAYVLTQLPAEHGSYTTTAATNRIGSKNNRRANSINTHPEIAELERAAFHRYGRLRVGAV